MVAPMASISLMPATIFKGIGSESQKKLEIIIKGELITATILTLLAFPIVCVFLIVKSMCQLSKIGL